VLFSTLFSCGFNGTEKSFGKVATTSLGDSGIEPTAGIQGIMKANQLRCGFQKAMNFHGGFPVLYADLEHRLRE